MQKIRVLIVDDSVVIRRLLSDELAKDSVLEIAGTAANGKIALAKIEQVQPDIVTMDIEMPEMDGLTAVSEIRKTHRKLPIIMFSTLSQRAAKDTLEALARGANDYVAKPSNVGSASEAMNRVRIELIPKIKGLCSQNLSGSTRVKPLSSLSPSRSPVSTGAVRSLTRPIEVLVIGVSTGGPNALAEFLPKIPKEFPVPILIVQHMPPVFTKCLGERLARKSAIQVAEGQPGVILRPGHAWIAPGDFHMTVQRKGTQVELVMNQEPSENFCRPAVDVLFRSVAQVYSAGVLGVVLTGMGQDGMLGAEVIRERGGQVYVQDEASSVVWGMPGAVVQAGQADKIVPLIHLPGEIVRKVKASRVDTCRPRPVIV